MEKHDRTSSSAGPEPAQPRQDQRNLRELVAQSRRLQSLGVLAGCIAHDFNNCLAGIELNAALLEMDIDEDCASRHALTDIVRLARTGVRMTHQLLAYARGEPERFTSIQLLEIVHETCDTFGRLHREIDVTVEGPTDLPPMKAARGQIEQLLMNLLFNSADAMPDGGRIHVRLSAADDTAVGTRPHPVRPGSWLRMQVADTGGGIGPQLLSQIFDRFFTTKETHGGRAGLGLASVYFCVRAHEGFVDVESAVGHGTAFTVWLPTDSEQSEDAACSR